MKSDGLLNKPLRSVVSEWEDNILFDADDPDFRSSSTALASAATVVSSSAAVLNALMMKGESNGGNIWFNIAINNKPTSERRGSSVWHGELYISHSTSLICVLLFAKFVHKCHTHMWTISNTRNTINSEMVCIICFCKVRQPTVSVICIYSSWLSTVFYSHSLLISCSNTHQKSRAHQCLYL